MPENLCCDECGSTFQRREHFQRHIRTHTMEKPFACSTCGQRFGRVDSLARHYNSMHLDRAAQMNSSRANERQRVAQACKRCSTSKVKCDGQQPCQKCRQTAADCVYEPSNKRKASQQSTTKPSPKRHADGGQSPRRLNNASRGQTASIPDTTGIPSQAFHFQGPTSPKEQAPSTTANFAPSPPHSLPNPSVQEDQSCTTKPVESYYDLRSIDPCGPYGTSGFEDSIDAGSWTNDDMDLSFWPDLFTLEHDAEIFQSICDQSTDPKRQPKEIAYNPPQAWAPTPVSDVAELYSRSHSPALDKDAVEVRQYHPTSIEIDAPLSFPEMDSVSMKDLDSENFAHIDGVSNEKVDAIARLAERLQNEPSFPQFLDLKIPPQPVLNAFVQLYFEYFHPVFPVLHKSSFSSPETHPLLVLVVAGIGAQFSEVKNAQVCARAIHELVRRQSSHLCETRNQYGRTLWMTQIVMLNALAMMHSGERRALEVAEILQTVPVALARRKRLFDDILTHERISQLHLPLEQNWRLWALDEERRRTGFGVWLVDSAFDTHFDLTTVMEVSELRNSLPQSEQRWNASSAQSWAGYPPGMGSGRTKSIGAVMLDVSWLSTWTKTGTIGKQVILRQLMVMVRPSQPSTGVLNTLSSNGARARGILESLLSVIEEDQREAAVGDLRALTTHKVTCLTALMACHSPATNLTAVTLRRIYGRLDSRELLQIAQIWKEAPHQGRLAVFYAARVFETVRSNHTTHFSMPVYLLKAVLTMWLYSLLYERLESPMRQSNTFHSVVIGVTDLKNVEVNDWVLNGSSRVKLPGMTNLLCTQGRRKFLDESVSVMKSLKGWGLSKIHSHLLRRLEASEMSSESA